MGRKVGLGRRRGPVWLGSPYPGLLHLARGGGGQSVGVSWVVLVTMGGPLLGVPLLVERGDGQIACSLVRVGACADELHLMGVNRVV